MADEQLNHQLFEQLARSSYSANKRAIVPKSFVELAKDLHQDLMEKNISNIDLNECTRKLYSLIVPNNSNNNNNHNNIDDVNNINNSNTNNDNNESYVLGGEYDEDIAVQHDTEDDEGSNLL